MNEVSEGPSNMKPLTASREKFWEERTTEDHVRILRDELARACRLIEKQSAQISTLMRHQHGENGELLAPIFGSNMSEEAAGGSFTHDRGIPHSLRTARERR